MESERNITLDTIYQWQSHTHTYILTQIKHAIKALPVNQIVHLQAEDEMVVNEADAMASQTCNPFCCVNYSCQQQAAKAVEKLMEER